MIDHALHLRQQLQLAVAVELIELPGIGQPYARWAERYWREWLDEPEHSENTLRPYLRALSGAAQEASWQGDSAALLRILEIYDAGFRYCTEEPLLTPYESSLIPVALFIADDHMIEGRLDACLRDLDSIERCLAIGDARRAQLGLLPRPNSEVRLYALGLRAICLADPLADGPPNALAAIQVVRDFWRIADAMLLRLYGLGSRKRETLLASTSRWEIEICKLAYLMDRELFAEAVRRFNARYGADLAADAATLEPQSDVRTAWHWDLEVWKHLHATEPPGSELFECLYHREAARRLTYGSENEVALKRFWARQARAA